MPERWLKSSYCAQGDSCVHVAGDNDTVRLTESGDRTGAVLRTDPTTWTTFLRTVKESAKHG